ncbi:pteridine reductase [Pseudomaricurvus alkylphenolicus]|uniref:pteridine reductase n=1 Tax=Pseudomaricurvus alkylphenolicus TaxID=1306991 RepID=UPI001422AFE3|nr:pteridine reductase [Pseudomaricurvus alkylphenolicus]
MTTEQPVALVTGGARRIGAAIVRELHQEGYRVLVHCRHSIQDAQALCEQLNHERPDTAKVVVGDLNDADAIASLAASVLNSFGRLDSLINNASVFYPTPVGEATLEHWDDLFASNARAPFFLSQALAPALTKSRGCIVNIADIHAEKPLKNYTIYCMAKAANQMLTRSLARELAPAVRVNSVAPGAIMWPENEAEMDADDQLQIIDRTPMKRPGHPDNIAQTVLYLLQNDFINGQIIAVDGGRSLT